MLDDYGGKADTLEVIIADRERQRGRHKLHAFRVATIVMLAACIAALAIFGSTLAGQVGVTLGGAFVGPVLSLLAVHAQARLARSSEERRVPGLWLALTMLPMIGSGVVASSWLVIRWI